MLILKDVNKSYTSNSKIRVDALKNINISFNTKGLIFILGPSGSGKSTLLNLIGGLDTPTSGNISINDEKINNDNKSLETYRNNYVSFIFQDFNLLTNLTVYENLSMVCFETKAEDIKRKVKENLSKVNLEGFENRYPNELSGGEIQRVAIARALMKNSSIILADEPTGNLNKENSKNICDLLKTISKEKLVIVVSHNEDLAKKYADRIIRIEDGTIIEDNNNIIINNNIINNINNNINDKFISNNYVVSKKNIFKLSIKNLFDKKIRFIISILSIIVAFAALSLSLSVTLYERPYIDYINIRDNNIDKFLIRSPNNETRVYNSYVEDIIQYKGIEYIRNGVIKSINEVINMGYDLYPNYREIDDNSIIISDSRLASNITQQCLYYISNDKEVDLEEFDVNKFNEYYMIDYLKSKVYFSGIYHTYGYNNYDPDITNIDTVAYDKAHDEIEKLVFKTENSIYAESLPLIDVGSKFDQFELKTRVSIFERDVSGGSPIFINDNIYGKYFNDIEYINKDTEIRPTGNEIYVSLKVYNRFFKQEADYTYYLGDSYFSRELIQTPIYVNKPFNLEITENSYSKSNLELENLVIKGILIDEAREIIMSPELKKKIEDFTINNSILIKTSSINNSYSFYKSIYKKYKLSPAYFLTSNLDMFESDLSFVQYISTALFALMVVLIVLINTIVISQMVKSKDKENGILRAIGVKKSSILYIYLLQSIFIILISFIMSLVFGMLFIKLLNRALVNEYSPNVSLILFRYQYAIIMLVITILANIIIGYISLHKAISKNPVDIIRQR